MANYSKEYYNSGSAMNQDKLRNIAIIAHVDHGKTTLVDAMLKQTKTFASYQKEFQQSTIMDSNDLERERGVTILAKNTSVFWHDYVINILDTPGHADFSGEVERVLNMADGCILLVDAAEGVLSQTRFVLSLALRLGLRPIVVLNKIDRKDQRADEVITEIGDLFLDVATDDEQLNFPILYAQGINGIAGQEVTLNEDHSLAVADSQDLTPLFELLVKHVPAPEGDANAPLQIQINSLDADNHIGSIVIGRVFQGTVKRNQPIAVVNSEGEVVKTARVEHLFTYHGLEKSEIDQAIAGEIIALSGVAEPTIGHTITSLEQPLPLPPLDISEPTVQMLLSINTSPFGGREAEYSTSRQLKSRLDRELKTNVGLRMLPGTGGESMLLVGRGELHLAILVETMRREGYEFSLSRPQVVIKEIDGIKHEPWESVTIDVPEDYTGFVTSSMAQRKANLLNMRGSKSGMRFEYEIATSNLIGYRRELISATSGSGVINALFLEFRPIGEIAEWHRGGAIIAQHTGQTTAYALEKSQQRGKMMVDPGEEVYAGQVVGINSRTQDMAMNVCKGKKLTNMRAASADATVVLAPAWKPSLEELMTLIAPDEMLEVTPESLRLRKQDLNVVNR